MTSTKLPSSPFAIGAISCGYLLKAIAFLTFFKIPILYSLIIVILSLFLQYTPKPRYCKSFPIPDIFHWIPLILMIPMIIIGLATNDNALTWPVNPIGIAFAPQIAIELFYDIKNRRTA